MGSGKDQLYVTHCTFNLKQVGLNPIASAVYLSRDLLMRGQDRFGPSQINDIIAPLLSENNAVDEIALSRRVFPLHSLPLCFAHLLEDYLLGSLRGNAPKLFDLDQ